MLTREQLLSTLNLKSQIVAVPGGDVCLRGLTSRERDARDLAFSKQREETGTLDNVRARTVAMALIGEDGKRLFSDPVQDPEAFEKDVALLGEKDGAVIDRLFDVVAKLSNLNEAQIEETEKNSACAPNGVSSSA